MTRFLLDTNIISMLMREPRGPIEGKIRAVGEDAVAISIIVAAELRFGAMRRQSARLTGMVEQMLERFDIVPLTQPVDAIYATIRARLERVGLPVGNADLWIAAHTLALDCTLVTDNVREFSRIEGLKMENWRR